MKTERLNEIYSVILFSAAVLMLLSLVSYSPQDFSFNVYPPSYKIHNFAGKTGAYFAFAAFFILGKTSFLLPFLTALWAISKYVGKAAQNIYIKIATTVVVLVSFSAFLSLVFDKTPQMKFAWGGLAGLTTASFFVKYFGIVGSYVIILTLFALSILAATEFIIIPPVVRFLKTIPGFFRRKTALANRSSVRRAAPMIIPEPNIKEIRKKEIDEKEYPRDEKPLISETAKPRIKAYNQTQAVKKTAPSSQPKIRGSFQLPPLSLLNSAPPLERRRIQDDFDTNGKILEGTLRDFGIETKVVSVHQGPVITRYELQPAAGVKINRIVNLSDDIALVMKAHSVRIVAPIPGKDRVGVEVPNSHSSLVYVRELLESSDFQEAESKLSLAVGKDIAGEAIIADLDGMPHLLIAGTTGSGKTVCVNALIISMLYKATPDELKFLMVDPKMVEMAPFNGLPHLLCPVITDGKKVSGALNWLVAEMENRYKIFAKLGVRNIEYYNKKISQDPQEQGEVMPYLVVIIDELADLMAVASQDIENAITRLAQLSRAVGIHMILATQRPSVDVITGVIKANFPARMSFKVASKVDSRTVLDMNGADKLLGKGDMLFLRPGEAKPVRAQSSLVSDEEIEKVVDFLKEQREAQYNGEILREQEKKVGVGNFERDELFDESVKLVLETGQASVSMLQRRLRLGYTRAARLIDAMEAEGIIGPFCGSKPREILIDFYEGSVEKQKEDEEAEETADEENLKFKI